MAFRPSDEDCRAEHSRFQRIDAAFRTGDLAALREAVEDPADVPNGPMPLTIGSCLEYAIYHSPVTFIRTLLELGASPVPPDDRHAGFPPLIAALSCSRAVPGAIKRDDTAEILRLLLSHGADPHQRGINDYTALHMAVEAAHAPAVGILLAAGADPRLRTRIDACETPGEMAARARLHDIERMLIAAERRLD
jgi:ankyrin repeat protein